MGIPEYWIVDYAALGGWRFIGTPRQPMIGIYSWMDGLYQVQQFRMGEQVQSRVFPDLVVMAEQLLQVEG